jgi:RNA polymerase sigma factor (sigma-70 family)
MKQTARENSYPGFEFFYFSIQIAMPNNKTGGVCAEEIFSGIFRKNARDLFRYLYYRFGADHHPEDLVQEAFAVLWQNCHKVLPEKARSFLFTVAGNLTLNLISKNKTARSYAMTPQKTSSGETPHYLLEEKEYMDRLQRAIDNLSPEQRVAFLLNRVDGKKHQEIAEILGISRKAVEKRIYTALEKLRKEIGDL